tara:strand:- start:914 stop:1303 length:390 start_codon:yes stop_codon:yes gene_type:complete
LKHLKIKKFWHEAKKSTVNDTMLKETLADFIKLDISGQQKYSLGAGLYKLRLASVEGRGKSAGSRSILAFKNNDRTIWLHLFSKNDKGNISTQELKKLKVLAGVLLGLSNSDIDRLIELGDIIEVLENV